MSEPRWPARAVLDADVIFSRVLHELLGRVASELRMLTLIWCDDLLAEAQRVLTERKPMPEAAAHRWVGYLREAFPEHRTRPRPGLCGQGSSCAHDVGELFHDPATAWP